MEEYRFERVNENNLDALVYLYKHALNENVTLESMKQKFNTSCFGAKNIGYIAYDSNNLPAAFYAVFPLEAKSDTETYLIGQSGDGITHPLHRRKGLFAKLSERTHIIAEEAGMKFLFGITYKEAYSLDGLVKYTDYEFRDDFNCYDIKIQSLPLYYFSNKSRITDKLYKLYSGLILSFIKKYKSFRDYKIKDWIEIYKDEKFFRYKTYNTSYIISLNKTRVWFKLKNNSILIGDIEKTEFLNVYKVIKRMKLLAFILGIRSIQFEISPGAYIDKEFGKYFKPINHFHIIFLKFDKNISTEKFMVSFGDFDSF